jgi:hypothetical protein
MDAGPDVGPDAPRAPWDDGYCGNRDKPPGEPATRLGDASEWAQSFVGPSAIGSLAVDPGGEVLVGGRTRDPFSIAGHAVETPLGVHGYVAQLSPDGAHGWSHILETHALERTPRVAFLPGGGSAAVLRFRNFLRVNGEEHTPAGGAVAVLSFGTGGDVRWVKILPAGMGTSAPEIAADSARNLYLVGSVDADADGGVAYPSVTKLDPQGKVIWQVPLEGPAGAYREVLDVAVGAGDDVRVAGLFAEQATLGDEVLRATGFGNAVAFVAKLEVDGAVVWARVIEGRYDARSLRLAVDPEGRAAIAGTFYGQLGPPEDVHASGQWDTDAFAIVFDGRGEVAWRASFGGERDDSAYAAAFRDDGSIAVGGTWWGSGVFGSSSLESDSIREAFVVTFDPVGAPVSGRILHSTSVAYVSGLAYLPSGALTVAGTFDCTIDVPLGTLWGGSDIGFVMVSSGLPPEALSGG